MALVGQHANAPLGIAVAHRWDMTRLHLLLFGLTAGIMMALTTTAEVPGVRPISPWQCPRSHPIKGNFTTYSGERCIYHLPGGAFYEKTKPERCYADEAEARADGCRRSKR